MVEVEWHFSVRLVVKVAYVLFRKTFKSQQEWVVIVMGTYKNNVNNYQNRIHIIWPFI